jgi:hypothetical protein
MARPLPGFLTLQKSCPCGTAFYMATKRVNYVQGEEPKGSQLMNIWLVLDVRIKEAIQVAIKFARRP